MKTSHSDNESISAILNRYKQPKYQAVGIEHTSKEFLPLFDSKEYNNSDLYEESLTCFTEVYVRYCEPHRHYHSLEHIIEIFSIIEFLEYNFSKDFILDLKMVALFHDAVYNPKSDSNEFDSAELFKQCIEKISGQEMNKHKHSKRFEAIYQTILDTKTHESKSELSEVFCALDMYVISHYSFEKLLNYEHQIFKEYQFVPYNFYKPARIEILKKLNQKYQRKEIDCLIEYVNFRIPRVGVYAGSFNPFHIGHKNILEKAERMFDKVIIARGTNPDKTYNSEFLTNLDETFPYHQITSFSGYLYDFMHELKQSGVEPYLIKGLRNSEDFNYELAQDYYNNHIYTQRMFNSEEHLPMHIIPIFGDSRFAHISSSAIRAMEKIEKGSGKWFVVSLEKPSL